MGLEMQKLGIQYSFLYKSNFLYADIFFESRLIKTLLLQVHVKTSSLNPMGVLFAIGSISKKKV